MEKMACTYIKRGFFKAIKVFSKYLSFNDCFHRDILIIEVS